MKEKEVGAYTPIDDQIEIINEKQIVELGGGFDDGPYIPPKTCGNLRKCSINNDGCPRLETCGWN